MKQQGVIKYYNGEKGYGFITPDGASEDGDLFFHVSTVVNRLRDPQKGDRVEFELGEGPKGPQAREVKLLDVEGDEEAADDADAEDMASDEEDFE